MKKLLATAAVLGAMASATEVMAQEISTEGTQETPKEVVVQQDSTSKDIVSTINRFDAVKGDSTITQGDTVELGEGVEDTDGVQDESQESEKPISVHGIVQFGTGVAGDFAEIFSERPTLTTAVDLSHAKSGLGITVVRLDDFHDDSDHPLSKATVLDLHWDKKFGKDKQFFVSAEGKYAFLDKLPSANGFSGDVLMRYDTKTGWTIEGVYTHKFLKGPDSDAIRLSISKKIDYALKLTLQGRYETGYDKKFYGRGIIDVDLGHGFGAQMSCIFKHGEVSLTGCVVFAF